MCLTKWKTQFRDISGIYILLSNTMMHYLIKFKRSQQVQQLILPLVNAKIIKSKNVKTQSSLIVQHTMW